MAETAPQDGKGGDIAAFSFNKQNSTLTFINKEHSGGDHPCHVEVDKAGKWIFASNYTSGSLSVLPVNEDGSLGKAAPFSILVQVKMINDKKAHMFMALLFLPIIKLFL